MPYIPTNSRREILRKDHFAARTKGEVNFVFSIMFLDIFKANKRYDTIHDLRKIVVTPSINPDFENMFYQIPRNGSGLDQTDIRVALDNAWTEFYDRVGRKYEDKAVKKNGDIYAELLQEIDNESETKPIMADRNTATSHSS